MKSTQYDRLAKLLTRKQGCTALEIIVVVGSVCPHKRLSDMKARGWSISAYQGVKERKVKTYFGVPPMEFS